ncbi:hypothetical protein NQ318_013889 [Aromia moschata]|uniref:Uncharacterized protein n=1 Tax=Aromia moschata TaxID=1265417 RepID=A0AAV8Z8M6_9CUCU|nr:hypothetical protein NQ318_013889 [Aromia moschata]
MGVNTIYNTESSHEPQNFPRCKHEQEASTLIVGRSETAGRCENKDEDTQCEIHKRNLLAQITGQPSLEEIIVDVEEINNSDSKADGILEEEMEDGGTETMWTGWANDVSDDADLAIEAGTEPNAHSFNFAIGHLLSL